MKKQPTPQPVVVSEVCSVCGENWALHIPDAQGNVSLIECIRVLKSRASVTIFPTVTQPWYPNTLPQTYPVWYRSGTSTGNWNANEAITCSSTAVN